MRSQDAAHVLYVDHQGHPAPLSMCYHATASRLLASAIERHPPSTITEVDSAYCPQCLSFYDATTAAALGYCPKASCRLCPLCRSIASIAVEDASCFYKCGMCDWTSRQCSLVTPVAAADGDVSINKSDIETASEQLLAQWTERRMQREQRADEHYKFMLQTLEGTAKEIVKGQRSTFFWLPNANVRRKDGPEGWSIESLEDSLQDRKKLVANALAETVGGQELQFASLFVDEALHESLQGQPIESLLLQGGGVIPESLEALLPLPVPLRPRKSRRCRAELAEGRPGILVKPKLNPLEGDSSLRTGHAQWWKKDSSAVQVLPRVSVISHASNQKKHAFLLKVANPTLGSIRMRLAPSNYLGEPVWDEPTGTTPLLEDILLDPFVDQQVTALLTPEVVQSLKPTQLCDLEPAEDSFLELGKSYEETPEAVSTWDAANVGAGSPVAQSGPTSSLSLIASKSSMAWFELVIMEGQSTNDRVHCAIPLAMQIEVGNGSWESSLVQPDSKGEIGGANKDIVTFNLVLVWENLIK